MDTSAKKLDGACRAYREDFDGLSEDMKERTRQTIRPVVAASQPVVVTSRGGEGCNGGHSGEGGATRSQPPQIPMFLGFVAPDVLQAAWTEFAQIPGEKELFPLLSDILNKHLAAQPVKAVQFTPAVVGEILQGLLGRVGTPQEIETMLATLRAFLPAQFVTFSADAGLLLRKQQEQLEELQSEYLKMEAACREAISQREGFRVELEAQQKAPLRVNLPKHEAPISYDSLPSFWRSFLPADEALPWDRGFAAACEEHARDLECANAVDRIRRGVGELAPLSVDGVSDACLAFLESLETIENLSKTYGSDVGFEVIRKKADRLLELAKLARRGGVSLGRVREDQETDERVTVLDGPGSR